MNRLSAKDKPIEDKIFLCKGLYIVMGTIMLDHKIGGMLDHDLIEENL